MHKCHILHSWEVVHVKELKQLNRIMSLTLFAKWSKCCQITIIFSEGRHPFVSLRLIGPPDRQRKNHKRGRQEASTWTLLQIAQIHRPTHALNTSPRIYKLNLYKCKYIYFLNLTMIRPCEIHRQIPFRFRVLRAQISTNLGILLTGTAWQNKNEAALSLGNICHAFWIVLLQINGRKAKLCQLPDLFLDYAVERRNHKNARIRVWGLLCLTKHLIYQALSEACWQNREDIIACEKRFQSFDLLRFQGIYFRKSR